MHPLRTALISLLAAAVPALAAAQTCATVSVDNVRPQQGHLMVAAYADGATFGKKPLTALRLEAGDAQMSFQLCGLNGTEVALMLFQDLDSDGRMGRNLVGLPIEPWGGSGAPGPFGPSWETGRVALDGRTITVSMSR